jgi:hypothetical protein
VFTYIQFSYKAAKTKHLIYLNVLFVLSFNTELTPCLRKVNVKLTGSDLLHLFSGYVNSASICNCIRREICCKWFIGIGFTHNLLCCLDFCSFFYILQFTDVVLSTLIVAFCFALTINICILYIYLNIKLLKHYVIQFVSDLRQVGGFLWVLRFPPPIKLLMFNI